MQDEKRSPSKEHTVSGGRHPSTPRTVTGRAMTILGAFSPERPAMGVKEISRRTGLAKSTTHRLVSELVEWGALSRGDEHADEYTYRVGPLVLRLAATATRGAPGKPA
jgi:DNA-binding IclR family transcriptional regulator